MNNVDSIKEQMDNINGEMKKKKTKPKEMLVIRKNKKKKKTLTEAKNVFDWLDMAEERISELEGI